MEHIGASEAMNSVLVPGTLVVSRRGYRHHGICAGRGRAVHYAGRDRYPLGCIEEIPLQDFIGKRALRVAIAPDALHGRNIVQRARLRFSECHYDLLSNNCEPFCTWCERGDYLGDRLPTHRASPFKPNKHFLLDDWLVMRRRVSARIRPEGAARTMPEYQPIPSCHRFTVSLPV